jgi:hypothetical protein
MGIAMLAATLTNQVSGTEQTQANTNTESTVIVETEMKSEHSVKKVKSTKESVEEYFQDIPVLVDVAFCESRFRQTNPDGSVLRGEANRDDVGVMQINEKYHLETSEKLGLDIHSLEGNMAYGRYLYEKFGTDPWEYSSKCWKKHREVALAK